MQCKRVVCPFLAAENPGLPLLIGCWDRAALISAARASEIGQLRIPDFS